MDISFQLRSALELVARAIKSSIVLIVAVGLMTLQAHAHETRPAIADVTVTESDVTLAIQINLEAFVAGVDLSSVADTDLSEQAVKYDALRALPPDQIKSAFEAYWPQMREGLTLTSGETVLEPTLVETLVVDEPNVELLRDSTITISATLPEGGAPVTIGWDRKFGPLVIRQIDEGPDAYTAFLRNGDLSDPLPRIGTIDESGWAVFMRYIVAGFEHIIPLGADHILFVLGIFFLSTKFKPLVLQVTTFTLAHTVTLAMGALGVIQIAPQIVEPLIAASIVYVAVENIMTREMKPWRLVIVFLFGLLHGLGFASVLGDFGLDGGRFITSLIGFNIGVEFGQLAVIAIAYLAFGIWFSEKQWYRSRISIPASLLIGLIGAYWFVERVFL